MNFIENFDKFNIGDMVSVFYLREENVEDELRFIGVVTQKNLKHLTFNICAHTQIEMKFSFFSNYLVKMDLLKKSALNFLQYKKKKKKILKILKKKKNVKKFKFFNRNLKKNKKIKK